MTILLLESLHPDAEALLERADELVRADDPVAPSCDFAQVRAIFTRGRGRIDAALIARCPALRVVAKPGAGIDNIDAEAARARGIEVVHAPGANAATVAEHTLALMLDLVRGVTRCAVLVEQGRWNERAQYRGDEIGGLTLGIVGFGAIGRRVAALAHAFGMNVLVAQHRGTSVPAPYLERPPDALFAEADVVSLHAPLTDATRHLVDARALARMKPTAYLVNTARGGLIEGAALRLALQENRLAGFAADVLNTQPPALDDPLLSCPRVLLTPHVASLTARTYRAMCIRTAEAVVRTLRRGGS